MKQIRGNTFVAINSWLTQRLDSMELRRFIACVRPQVARSISEPEGWAWYPLNYLTEIYQSIAENLKDEDNSILDQLGQYIAEADMGGGPKIKGTLLPVPRVLARMPFLWAKHKDCGEVNVEENGTGHSALLTLTGYETDMMHCEVNSAWMKSACQILSGTKVEVVIKSIAGGNGTSSCTWLVSWNP